MNKRFGWIDISRGIGIILVVLGHTLTTVIREDYHWALNLYDVVYFFHMALMFFVSGVAFNITCEKYKKLSVSEYIRKKGKKLILPYISYSFLIFICFSIANSVSKLAPILDRAGYGKITFVEWLKELITAENLYCQHLWYIYSLFLLSFLAFILLHIFGEKYKFLLFVFTFFLWYRFLHMEYYAIVWKTAAKGIWFAAGTFVGAGNIIDKRKKYGPLVCVPLLILFKYLITLYDVTYSVSRFLDLLIMLGIILAIRSFSQILDEKGDSIFKWFGKKSFPIYLFHQPFFGSGLGVVLYGQLHLNVFICILISFVCCIFIPLIFEKILDNKRLPFLKKILLG